MLHLYPTPSAASTYYVDIEAHIENMVNANDEPLIPEEFHHLLGLMVRKKDYEMREKWKAHQVMVDEIRVETSKLITWVGTKTGLQDPGTARRRHSQLGGWYPAGT